MHLEASDRAFERKAVWLGLLDRARYVDWRIQGHAGLGAIRVWLNEVEDWLVRAEQIRRLSVGYALFDRHCRKARDVLCRIESLLAREMIDREA